MEQTTPLPVIIHPSWHEHLKPLFELPDMVTLKSEILIHGTFYPNPPDIFRVFKMPLDKIRVVILGQDPYPKGNIATGLAFAVPQDSKMPPSLQIIAQELRDELPSATGNSWVLNTIENTNTKEWKTLLHWEEQGVFLLNTALTVRRGQPNSHKDYWKDFIDGVIRIIAEYQKPIWLLWGAGARDLGTIVFEYHEPGRVVGSLPNRTMSAGHPVTESYSQGKGSFYGCNHFYKVNKLLADYGQEAINW